MEEQNIDQEKMRKAVIEELGLQGLSSDKQDELLIKMIEVVLKRIFAEAISKLSAQDQDEYLRMIDSKEDQEKIEIFLQEKIANYNEMVQKIIVDFKEEMKSV